VADTPSAKSEKPSDPVPDPPRRTGPRTNQDWWPNQARPSGAPPALAPCPTPLGEDFDYKTGVRDARPGCVESGDVFEVDERRHRSGGPAELRPTTGPLFHPDCRGTRRAPIASRMGRGGWRWRGAQRFRPPSTGWPDNAKPGQSRAGCSGRSSRRSTAGKISWADLRSSSRGNCAMESMGFETFGFRLSAARTSSSPRRSSGVPRTRGFGVMSDTAATGELGKAVRRGGRWASSTSIPRVPTATRIPLAGRQGHPRGPFARMAMNDEENGRADHRGATRFGKTHGCGSMTNTSGRRPEGPRQSSSSSSAGRTATAPAWVRTRRPAGIEGAWTKRAHESGTTASSRTCSSTTGS